MDWILHLLPGKPQPLYVKYGVTAAITCFAYAVEHTVWLIAGDTALFILLPAVFFSGLAFDRGSGVLSAVLATLLIGFQRSADLDRIGISAGARGSV
jgi:hypothetical protein